jgi:hypothetical protein
MFKETFCILFSIINIQSKKILEVYLLGEVPVSKITLSAILLCKHDFSTAAAAIRLPKNIIIVPYYLI